MYKTEVLPDQEQAVRDEHGNMATTRCNATSNEMGTRYVCVCAQLIADKCVRPNSLLFSSILFIIIMLSAWRLMCTHVCMCWRVFHVFQRCCWLVSHVQHICIKLYSYSMEHVKWQHNRTLYSPFSRFSLFVFFCFAIRNGIIRAYCT